MMFFNPSAMTALPLHIAIRTEMAMAGLDYYKSKPIKKFPWLVGVARDLTTVGCMTVREINGNMDIAVYPCLSLKEVIDSFANKDHVASVNCKYFNNFKAAARFLRQYLEE